MWGSVLKTVRNLISFINLKTHFKLIGFIRCKLVRMADNFDLGPCGSVKEPLDVFRLSLDGRILVKMRNGRQLSGRLHAFDQHLNMILGDVEETVRAIEIDEETFEEVYREKKRLVPMLFVRGDGVIVVSSSRRGGI